MAQKFYGVRLTDGQTAILTNWDDAKAFIAKNPKGAVHKSFKTEAEARAFVEQTETAPSVAHENMKTDCPKQRLIAYVDGSYNPDTKTWGYGVVMFDAADETREPHHPSVNAMDGASGGLGPRLISTVGPRLRN